MQIQEILEEHQTSQMINSNRASKNMIATKSGTGCGHVVKRGSALQLALKLIHGKSLALYLQGLQLFHILYK